MNNKISFGLASLIVFVLSSLLVSAAGVCSLSLGTKDALYTGDTTTISFVNLYLPPETGNITLDLSGAPGISISAGANPQDDIAFGSMASWDLGISSEGTKTITATMINSADGTVLCTNSTSFTVVPYPDIVPTIMGIGGTFDVGDSIGFSLDLDNLGPGNATDISGTLSSASGNLISPNSMSLAGLDAGDSSSTAHTILLDHCGSGDSVSATVFYRDENGVLMAPRVDVATFNVIGTDMAFTSISATPSVVNAGNTVTLRADVKNIYVPPAENVKVTFFVDGNAVNTASLGNIAGGVSDTASYVYTTAAGGSHNVTATLTADHECPDPNNAATLVDAFTVSGSLPFCGDGSCNNGESCSSCPGDCGSCSSGGSGGGGGGGGRSGDTYILILTPAEPSKTLHLKSGDTVKYITENESFSFVFRYVYSDRAKMGVSKATSYKEYTLDEDKKYNLNLDAEEAADLGITPSELNGGAGDFKFELLNLPERTPIVVLPPAKRTVSVDQTADLEAGSEEPVPEEESFSEGVLEFVESLSVKSKAPIGAGIAVAAAIVLLGLGAYFFVTRKRD